MKASVKVLVTKNKTKSWEIRINRKSQYDRLHVNFCSSTIGNAKGLLIKLVHDGDCCEASFHRKRGRNIWINSAYEYYGRNREYTKQYIDFLIENHLTNANVNLSIDESAFLNKTTPLVEIIHCSCNNK